MRRLLARQVQILESRRLLHAAGPLDVDWESAGEVEFDPGSVLVRYHSQAADHAPVAMKEFDAVPGLRHLELADGLDLEQTIEFYQNHPGVLYAEPNFHLQLATTPSDPDYNELWGLHNEGQTGGTSGADIDAPEAWQVTTGNPDTIIAVVDTGVDYLHPDLIDNMWVNPGEIAGDGIDNDGNGFVDDVHGYDFVSNDGSPMDDHNHGTHVAGTIGASANNGIGVVGVNWDVQIMAVKFLNAQGSGSTAAAVGAIEYAVDNGASISNHSWGFNGNFSQALSDAIEYARQADHLVIAAAGNGGRDQIGDDNDMFPFYPGNFAQDNVIVVAATDHEDELAWFSNYGANQVDLAAPGVGILSTTRGNTYSSFNGTSMATPHVAGAAALLRGLYPDWDYHTVRDRIFDTIDPIAELSGLMTTGGRLNVGAAVAPDLAGPSIVDRSLTGDVMKAQDRIVLSFDERIDPASFTVEDVTQFVGPAGEVDIVSVEGVPFSGGRQYEIVFESQATLGEYTFFVGPNVSDPFGNPMDQNEDGVNGEPIDDRYSVSFTIVPDTVGPFIVSVTPQGSQNEPIDRIRVVFDEPILPETFTSERIVDFVGPAGSVEITSIDQISATEYDVVFPTQDTLGNYSLAIAGSITDPSGNPLDQDQDGLFNEVDDDRYLVSIDLERWLYADRVIDFSSQFTSTSWSAAQALGTPDTFAYGDYVTAWAPLAENGTTEFLTVGFEEPLLASGVVIRETFGNGFVREVEVRNAISGEYSLVAQPDDTSVSNTPFDFQVSWPQTTFPVDAVRITIDTDHNLNAFEEIDAVQLRGVTVPDTDGARVTLASPLGSVPGPISRLELTFDEAVQDGTFTLDDVVELSGPDGPIEPTAVNRLTSSRYEILFSSQSSYGDYVAVVGPDILDLDGLAMNQDQDVINGESIEDRFEANFKIEKFQFADSVIDFSSQFGTTTWSAEQALGPSDTQQYGDSRDAWAPAKMNGTIESLTVGFADPVLATGVVIRETFGNGFVRKIDVRDAETGVYTTVATPVDNSPIGEAVDFVVEWPITAFAVDAVRIEIDTDQTTNYEEIDSVQLRGVPAPDLLGPRIVRTVPDAGHPAPLDQIDLVFSEPIDESTFTLDDIDQFEGPGGPIAVQSIDRISETEYRIVFPEQETRGAYELVLGTEILDLAGNPMNQDGDDLNGELIDDRVELSFNLELWQSASSVIDFSSQYSATSWSAEQTLGPANTFDYGDSRDAWAPSAANGTTEYLTVGFETPVRSTGAVIRETYGNGFVRLVEVRDVATGEFTVVSDSVDPSQAGAPVDYIVSWPITDFAVDALRITIDTNHSLSFEEIDAVHLRGIVPPDTVGATISHWTPDGGHPGPIEHVELKFDEPINPDSFTTEDVIEFVGPEGSIEVTDVSVQSETEFRVHFAPQSVWGTYSMILGPEILDAAGNSMDQNQDGVSGVPGEDEFSFSFALELWQDANTVIDFSSQYSATSWSAEQALGPANTFVYGDSRDAWAPKYANGTTETLTLGFAMPVNATGAVIRETYGNGFVRMVELRDSESMTFHTVSTTVDDSQPGTPVDYTLTWPITDYSADAIRITIDTGHSFGFEEIDSVTLRGIVAPDTTGPRIVATSPDATHSGSIDHLDVQFNEPIDSDSFTIDDLIQLNGPSGAIAAEAVSQVDDVTYRISFATQTDFGTYTYTLGPAINDLAGNLMDQNENGVSGELTEDSFSHGFEVELWQYASTVISFSSQYSPWGWAAIDAVGEPDTLTYGDSRHAWAPRYANAGDETITLGFDTPVYSSGAIIRETFGNGFVREIEVRDALTGVFHSMQIGPDTSAAGTPVEFEVNWPLTQFLVDAIRITIDTTHSSTYEEIDAVRLKGVGE